MTSPAGTFTPGDPILTAAFWTGIAALALPLALALQIVRLRMALRAPVAAPGAQLFRLQSTRDIDGGATTFHHDKAALPRLLPRLEADFGAWAAFRGMAVHELR